MKTLELKTIEELAAKVKSNEIDGSKLTITLDNDDISFYVGDEEKDPDNFIEVIVEEAKGYPDILPLYKLVFPDAIVEWC